MQMNPKELYHIKWKMAKEHNAMTEHKNAILQFISLWRMQLRFITCIGKYQLTTFISSDGCRVKTGTDWIQASHEPEGQADTCLNIQGTYFTDHTGDHQKVTQI